MVRAKKQHSDSSPIESLTDDLLVEIVAAHVPRRDYKRVSLLSKRFRSLIKSPRLYKKRSTLDCADHYLTVVLYNRDNGDERLYTILPKANRNGLRLVLFPRIPSMPRGGSFVAVGWRIYVFGGINYDDIECFQYRLYIQHSANTPEHAFPHV